MRQLHFSHESQSSCDHAMELESIKDEHKEDYDKHITGWELSYLFHYSHFSNVKLLLRYCKLKFYLTFTHFEARLEAILDFANTFYCKF